MNFTIEKDIILENVTRSSHFTSSKLSTIPTLQGVLLKTDGEKIHFYSTNLNSFFHAAIALKTDGEMQCIIDPRKVGEFVNLLPGGPLEVDITDKQLLITKGKTKGNFALMVAEDFPMPPVISEKEQTLKTSLFRVLLIL